MTTRMYYVKFAYRDGVDFPVTLAFIIDPTRKRVIRKESMPARAYPWGERSYEISFIAEREDHQNDLLFVIGDRCQAAMVLDHEYYKDRVNRPRWPMDLTHVGVDVRDLHDLKQDLQAVGFPPFGRTHADFTIDDLTRPWSQEEIDSGYRI